MSPSKVKFCLRNKGNVRKIKGPKGATITYLKYNFVGKQLFSPFTEKLRKKGYLKYIAQLSLRCGPGQTC